MSEKSLKSSKIEMYSWPPRSYGQLQGLKIAFLVKMAKMVSFRPNHRIFGGFVDGSGKIKKKYTEILRKDQI
jgi:hypothetical protein